MITALNSNTLKFENIDKDEIEFITSKDDKLAFVEISLKREDAYSRPYNEISSIELTPENIKQLFEFLLPIYIKATS